MGHMEEKKSVVFAAEVHTGNSITEYSQHWDIITSISLLLSIFLHKCYSGPFQKILKCSS